MMIRVFVLFVIFAIVLYQNCPVFSETFSGKAPKARGAKPYYVHVPKTGSSFMNMLISAHCPPSAQSTGFKEPSSFNKEFPECRSEFSNFESGHAPLPRSRDPEDVVFMMRDPMERGISGFLGNLHSCRTVDKVCKQKWNSLNLKLNEAQPDKYKELIEDDDFVKHYFSVIKGQATKQLSDSDQLNEESLKRALEVISGAAFVGLTDEWESSMKRYASEFGGDYKKAMQNVRPSKHPELKDLLRKKLIDMGWEDEYDARLYEATLKRLSQEG